MRGETSVSADVLDVPDHKTTLDVKSEHITEVSRRATLGVLENILGRRLQYSTEQIHDSLMHFHQASHSMWSPQYRPSLCRYS